MIGSSSGNGHPFSWSSILNGFDVSKSEYCDFPGIVTYLNRKEWPQSRIPGVEVTHVWTQDSNLTERLSKFSSIPNIVSDYREMAKDVDAVIIARDDSDNHFEFAEYFSRFDLPILLDKPIATSSKKLEELLALPNAKNNIFSSSSVIYSPEFKAIKDEVKELILNNKLKSIEAITPNIMSRYGVHIIEPVVSLFNEKKMCIDLIQSSSNSEGETIELLINGIAVKFKATGASAGAISFEFKANNKNISFEVNDVFSSFHALLLDFVSFSQTGIRQTKTNTVRVVEILDKGMYNG